MILSAPVGSCRRITAGDFWETVAENMDEWQLVREGKITAGEVRQDYINSHAVVLQALGRAGQTLLCPSPRDPQGNARTASEDRLEAVQHQPVGRTSPHRRSGLQGTAVSPPDHQRHQAAARA